MGLGEPKKRKRTSHDPNNTTWTRSTTTYGHKILSPQGWTPGNFLGARSAAHASHYTAANASHVRVLLKDDTLGLGAKRCANVEEQFGLGALQGLFGRLNGKGEEDILAEKWRREEVGRALWVERRFGGMRFVRGGLLVGNQIVENMEEQGRTEGKQGAMGGVKPQSPEAKQGAGKSTSDENMRDRGLGKLDEGAHTAIARFSKKTKGEMKEKFESGSVDVCTSTSVTAIKKLKEKRKREVSAKEHSSSRTSVSVSARASTSASFDEKADKRRGKEERKARKAAKRAERAKVTREGDTVPSACSNQRLDLAAVGPATTSPPVSASAPLQASLNTGRHAVRQRYIAQKRMACIDAQALKEGAAVRKSGELHQTPAGRKTALPEKSPYGRLEAFNREHEARIVARLTAIDGAEESARSEHISHKALEPDAAAIAKAWAGIIEFAGIHLPSMEVATEIMKFARIGARVRAQERFNRPMPLRQFQSGDSGPSSGSTLYSTPRELEQNVVAPLIRSLGSTAGNSRYPGTDNLHEQQHDRHELRKAEVHVGHHKHTSMQDHHASKPARVHICPVDWVANALRQSYEGMTSDLHLKLHVCSQDPYGRSLDPAAIRTYFGALTEDEVTKLRLYRTRAFSQAVVCAFSLPTSRPECNGEPLHDWYTELMALFKHHFHSLIGQAGVEITDDAFHNIANAHCCAILQAIRENWGILPIDQPHATGISPRVPFVGLGRRAYHLTMQKPSYPPPAVWAPPRADNIPSNNNDPPALLHPYYQSIIHRFSRAFRSILQSHNDPLMDPAMDAELEDLIDRHVINILVQLRQVWIEEFKMPPRYADGVGIRGFDGQMGDTVMCQQGSQGLNVELPTSGGEYPTYEQNLNMHVLHGMNAERWGI